jgi:hypothetical protein
VHDGCLLTLEDTVEFFNLVLELEFDEQEKKDLVAFMRGLLAALASPPKSISRSIGIGSSKL